MTELLGTADLGWMRTEQNRLLPGTAVIERVTLASDGMGGYSETWAAVGTVTARLYPYPVIAREYVAGEQDTSVTQWWLTLPHGTDITAVDRVLMSSTTYEIQSVNHDEEYKTAVRCVVYAHNERIRT